MKYIVGGFLSTKLSFLFLMFLVVGCQEPLETTEVEIGISDEFNTINRNIANLDGKNLYQKNCMSCHGSFESSQKFGRTAVQIDAALGSINSMKYLSLLDEEVSAIAKAWGADSKLFNELGDQSKFTCSVDSQRQFNPKELRRLSKLEYKNSLEMILGEDISNQLKSIDRFPTENISESVATFVNIHTFQQVDAIFNTTLEIGDALSTTELSNSLGISCLTDQNVNAGISVSCRDEFLNVFGLKVARRPLSNNQKTELTNIISGDVDTLSAFSKKDRLLMAISRMFQFPEFNFHLEELENNSTKLDQYSIASRISFTLTGGPPDDLLMEAASNKSLIDLAAIKTQALRLIDSSNGKEHVKSFFSFWLKLDETPAAAIETIARAGLSTSGNNRNQLSEDLVQELHDFVSYITFETEGDFSDLMTSSATFPKTNGSATVLGAEVDATNAVFKSERAGLISRPAILLSNLERERPIHRGTLLRTRILCDDIPPPPPDADGEAESNLSVIDPLKFSSRDITSITTQNNSCTSCHSLINPLGFVVGKFGPLGEYRDSTEITYNLQNQIVESFNINSHADGLNLASEIDSASDHLGLAEQLKKSTKAQACLPQFLVRFNSLRLEDGSDDCRLSSIEKAVRSGASVKEIILAQVLTEDIFYKGKR